MVERIHVHNSDPDIFDDIMSNIESQGGFRAYKDKDKTELYIPQSDWRPYFRRRFEMYDFLLADPDIVVDMFVERSRELEDVFPVVYQTTVLDYNPIWNVDGTTVTEREDTAGKSTTVTDSTKTVTKQDTDGTRTTEYGRKDTEGGDQTVTNTYGKTESVNHADNGYDSSTAAPSFNESGTTGGTDKAKTDFGHTSQASGKDVTTVNNGQTSTTNSGDVKTVHSGKDSSKETVTRQGNIGVTTTQQMIREEREVALSMIGWYLNQFADLFTLRPFAEWFNPSGYEPEGW